MKNIKPIKFLKYELKPIEIMVTYQDFMLIENELINYLLEKKIYSEIKKYRHDGIIEFDGIVYRRCALEDNHKYYQERK